MSPGVFLALSTTVAVVALTPGPAVTAIVARAMADGVPPAMAVNAGVVTGDVLFLLLAAAGMAAAAGTMGGAFDIVRLLGAAYLAWQGAVLWRKSPQPPGAEGDLQSRLWPNYTAGLLLMFGHVQAMLFYAALLPGFVDVAALTGRDLGLIALMLVVVIGGVNTCYAVLAARARRLLASNRSRRALQRVAGSLMFVAAALVATRV